jgi:uncharacterized membrane protein YgcG
MDTESLLVILGFAALVLVLWVISEYRERQKRGQRRGPGDAAAAAFLPMMAVGAEDEPGGGDAGGREAGTDAAGGDGGDGVTTGGDWGGDSGGGDFGGGGSD